MSSKFSKIFRCQFPLPLGLFLVLSTGLSPTVQADILAADAVNPVVGQESNADESYTSGSVYGLRESGEDLTGGFSRPYHPPLHRGKSQIRVVSSGAYEAVVNIFDQYAQVVTTFTQEFDPESETGRLSGHYLSYLTWNLRSDAGHRVGNGVYIWRISFVHGSGQLPKTLFRTICVMRESV
jgi:hypothetical protein